MELTESAAVAQKPRQTMLPLLVVLFLISYVLLTTLVVLQNRTIDSQSSLIHLLFKDNFTLVTKAGLHRVQGARLNQKATASASVQTPSTQAPSTQVPSTQALTSATPSTQVPVIQAKPDVSAKAGQKSRKVQKALPSRPPAEVTDPSDMRRTSFSI